MKGKRNILFLSIVAVVLLLLIAVGSLLVRSIRHFGVIEQKLAASKGSMKSFYDKAPFPSNDNVNREKENVHVINGWVSELLGDLRVGQIAMNPEQRSPSRFMSFLGAQRNKLVKLAAPGVLPDNFAFGFGSYFGEDAPLPPPEAVPRLTQQLQIIEGLCEIILKEKTFKLSMVEREEFERGQGRDASRPKRRAARPHPPSGASPLPQGASHDEDNVESKPVVAGAGTGGLFAKQWFAFEFETEERFVLNILNRLACHDMFIVVTSIRFSKGSPDVVVPESKSADGADAPADAPDDAPAETPADAPDVASAETPAGRYKRERLVCGPNMQAPLRVRIELDVYDFKGA